MPKVFKFDGPKVVLGALGTVSPGDTLVLTDKEANDIKADKRFRPLKPEAATRAQLAEAICREESQLTKEDLRAWAEKLGIHAACWITRQTLLERIKAAEQALLDAKVPAKEPANQQAPEALAK